MPRRMNATDLRLENTESLLCSGSEVLSDHTSPLVLLLNRGQTNQRHNPPSWLLRVHNTPRVCESLFLNHCRDRIKWLEYLRANFTFHLLETQSKAQAARWHRQISFIGFLFFYLRSDLARLLFICSSFLLVPALELSARSRSINKVYNGGKQSKQLGNRFLP